MESLTIGNCWKTIGEAAMRAAAVSLVLLAAWQVASPGEALAVPSGYHLVYTENFNGSSIDDTTFRPVWSDYDGAYGKSDAVSVDNGIMKLSVYTDENDDHWGSCVSTNRTFSYTYGYCEARVKFCNDQGCTMSYWMTADARWNDSCTADEGVEIDIIEQRATDGEEQDISNMYHLNLWAGPYDDDYGISPNPQPTVNDLEDEWHVVQCEWNSNGYTFWCDTVQKWKYEPTWWQDWINGEIKCSSPEWMIFSADPSMGWAGDPLSDYGSLATTDTYMEVDYCKVYQMFPMFWKQGSGGSGTWNSSNTNWGYDEGGSASVYDEGEEVYLRGTAGTITIASGYTPNVRGLHFETDGYTITGSSLNLHRSDVIVNEDLTATIASTVTGTKGLRLLGEGKLILSGNNTYSGETNINQDSVLNIRHANALGSTSDGTVVHGYAALEIQGGITTAAEPLTLSGPGINWDGALRSVSGNNTYTGLITLSNFAYIATVADSLTISNAGTITGDGHKLYVRGNGNTTINSVIGTGSGGLYKDGAGTLTLTRANTFTGETEVIKGTLAYGTNNVLASGDLTVGGDESWLDGTVNMGSYSDTVGAVTLKNGTITGTGTLTSTEGFYVESGTVNVHLAGSVANIGLTKTGTSTVTLNNTNTYTGRTYVNEGTLAYAVNNAIAGNVTVDGGTLNIGSYSDTVTGVLLNSGSITGTTGTLTSTGIFVLNEGTVSAKLSGSVGLMKSSVGTSTLSGANTYTGATTVYAGTLAYGANNAIYNGTVTVNGGSLNIGSYSDTVGAVTLTGGTITGTTGTLTGSSYALQSGTVGAIIGGSGAVTKSTSGTVTMTKANTYTGSTAVGAGVLNIRSNNALGTAANGTTVSSGAALEIQGGINYSTAETVTLYGTGVSSGGALRNVSGNNTFAGLVTADTGDVRINSDSGELHLSNTGIMETYCGDVIFGGAGDIVVDSHIYGNISGLQKDGSGKLTLTNTNTYDGATTISAGTMALSGSGTLGSNSALRITGDAALNLGGTTQSVGTVGQSGAGNGIVGDITNGTLNIQNHNMYFQEGTLSANVTSTPGSSGRLWIGGDSNATVYLGGVNTVQYSDTHSTIIGYGTTGAVGTVVLTSNTALGPASQEAQLFTGTLDLNGQTGVTVGNIKLKYNTSSKLVNDNTSTAASYAGTIDLNGHTPYIGGDGDMTLSGAISNGSFVKIGDGTLTLSGNNTYAGLTTVQNGTLELTSSGAWNRVLSYGGCDIQQGQIYFDSTALEGTITSLLTTSYDDGDWDTGQFLCTTADEYTGLGWATDANGVTVRYTLYGDLNLDGYVTSAEVSQIWSNDNMSNADWSDGDMNYDGYVDIDDWYLALPNSGDYQSLRLEIDEVPEPSTIALLATGLLGLLAYAWRKRK